MELDVRLKADTEQHDWSELAAIPEVNTLSADLKSYTLCRIRARLTCWYVYRPIVVLLHYSQRPINSTVIIFKLLLAKVELTHALRKIRYYGESRVL